MLRRIPDFMGPGAISGIEVKGDKLYIVGFKAASARKHVQEYFYILEQMKVPDEWEEKELYASG